MGEDSTEKRSEEEIRGKKGEKRSNIERSGGGCRSACHYRGKVGSGSAYFGIALRATKITVWKKRSGNLEFFFLLFCFVFEREREVVTEGRFFFPQNSISNGRVRVREWVILRSRFLVCLPDKINK